MKNTEQTKQVSTDIAQVKSSLEQNNIELVTFSHSAFYETDLSLIWFIDFKADWENQSLWLGLENDYLVFFASPELMKQPYYKVSHLRKMTKQALYELCEEYEILNSYHSECNFEDNTKQTLIDELLKYVDNEKYYRHHFNETSWCDLDYDFYVTGYCQGDKKLIKLVGTEKQFKDKIYYPTSKHLTNLFYDTPIYLRVECFVNENLFEELYLDEYLKDIYGYYEKDEVIEMIKKHYADFKYFQQLLAYVSNHLPETLEYH